MGVYIKGMEMPKDCIVCPFGWNGCNKQHDFVYMGSRPDFCPLIDVHEPHGRLIEAEPLIDYCKRFIEAYDYSKLLQDHARRHELLNMVGEIASAPTIIEAEE